MREPKVGDMVWTNDDIVEVRRIGINCIEGYNGVNTYKIKFEDITGVL